MSNPLSKLAPTNNLEQTYCDICKDPILIILTSPATDEEKKLSSGLYLFWMDENYEERLLQNLCDKCANELCEDGLISIGFDGDAFDGLATTRYLLDERSQLKYMPQDKRDDR